MLDAEIAGSDRYSWSIVTLTWEQIVLKAKVLYHVIYASFHSPIARLRQLFVSKYYVISRNQTISWWSCSVS